MTETAEETTVQDFIEDLLASQAQEEREKEKDWRKIPARKPPKDGLCRRCGQNKPVNRLMLCYPCWVKTNLEKRGWREGEPHPDWCDCTGVAGHPRLSDGN